MIKLKVGGVPEHFNLPWHLAIENGLFEKEGLDVEWQTFKGGTGQMTKALEANETDVCVLLTEGIANAIVKGNPSKIISKYINTPLIWGVFSGANNPIKYYGEIFDKQYAISRFGSGSHLMPQVDAFSNKRKLKEEQFTIIKNLDGALPSLQNNETDVFYWERFMTQPHVDSGVLKRLGEFVTPWPCFVIAASQKIIEEQSDALRKMLDVIYFVNEQFMRAPNTIAQVSERYGLKEDQVQQWFYSTEWCTSDEIKPKTLENVLNTLKMSGVIDRTIPVADLCVKL